MARNLDADMYAGSAYGRTTNAGTAKAKQTYSWGGKSYDSVMDMHNAIFKDSDSSDKAPVSTALAKAQPGAKKGLASKPKTTTEVDPKERFFTGINTIFTESGADLDVYKPSVDIGAIYTQEQFTGSLSAAQGYVYRADMAEQTRELIAEAMNYDQDQINAAIRDINDAALKGVTDKEMVKRYLNDMAGMGSDKPDPLGGFGVPPLTLKDVTDSDVDALSNPQPLYDMADEFANPSITTTELPSVEEEASLQETIQGLVDFSQVRGRDNPFQGGVQVALAGMTEQEFYQQANEVREMLGLPLLDVPAAEPEPTVSQPSLSDIAATRQRLREQAEPQGLMSRRLDTKGQIDTPTLVADAYLRDKDFVADDTTITLDAAISGTDFKNRRKAMRTIGDALDTAYSSPITSQAILTTIEHESGTRLIEGTNYNRRRAIAMLGGGDSNRIARINALYGRRNRLTQEEQEELLNIAYGGRMGNAANEGYKYRGRGLIQITGKNNYRAVGEALGIGDALVDNPDLLLEDPTLMLAATDAYLTSVKGMDRNEALTANDLKDMIGHSGSAPEGFNGTGTAYAGMERWNEVIDALEDAGKLSEADEARLNNEFTAQQTVGTYIDGDIGPNSITAMRRWLSSNGITVPEDATGMVLVRLVNEVAG